MDIEAIQKRNESRLGCMHEKQLPFYFGENAVLDCKDLLDYISALESENKELKEKLRWKKVAEEKPEIGKEYLIKGRSGKRYVAKYVNSIYSPETIVWDTGHSYLPLGDYPRYREIGEE